MIRVNLYRNTRSNRRGFALAPILYLLGLIGVMVGVLFSGYSQVLKTGQTVQNSMTVKSDLQAAANTLSAQAVFGTNGLTLCPPRSVHQSSGDPCAAAPVSLIQFADFTGTQLPANYANAGTTGSPVEVGVFAAGSGAKVLDPYGHTYIYCRWENSSGNPASPAFVLLSAGANGNLQTRCGDTSAQGDDNYLMVTVGAAINHAALWQTVGTSTVGFGATGTQVTVDNSGDVNAAGNISAQNAAIANAITAGTLTTSGNITTADISANTLTTSGNITSSATVIGTSGEFTNLSGSNLNISGEATIIGTSFLGNLSAGASILNALTVTNSVSIGGGLSVQGSSTVIGTSTLGGLSAGATTLNSLTVTNSATLNSGLFIQGGDLDLANGNSYAQIDSTGVARRLIALSPTNDVLLGGRSGTNNIYFLTGGTEVGWFDTSGNFTVTGNITGANGSFGNLGAAATTLTGNLTGTNATFSGTVTASSFIGNLNLGASGSSISGIVPLANGGTGYAASSVSNLLNNLFSNDTAPSVTIPVARLPALSGDVTHAAGSSTTSIAAIRGIAITGVTGSGNVVLSASPTITGTVSGANAYFSGDVGIGITNPANPLSVVGQIQTLANNTATTNTVLITAGNMATAGSTNVNRLRFGGNDANNNYFTIQGVSNTDYFTINNGNIGIGTTVPWNQLANTSLNIVAADTTGLSNQSIGWVSTTGGYVAGFYNANSSAFNADGLAVKVTDPSAVALDVSIGTSAVTAGTSLLRVLGNGNVGIGITNPGNLLTVNGQANLAQILMPNTGSNYISAIAGGSFTFQTNNANAMSISNDGVAIGTGFANIITPQPNSLLVQGNVGIGTASPASPLDVYGIIMTHGYGGRIMFNDWGGGTNNWQIYDSYNTMTFYNGIDGTVDLAINRNAGQVQIANKGLTVNGGNVGLGTTSPATNLEVSAGYNTAQILWPELLRNVGNANTTGYGVGLKLKNSIDSGNEANKWVGIAGVAGGSSGYSNDTDMVFYANINNASPPSEKMRITGAGNVGIGTTSPTSALQINGVYEGGNDIFTVNVGQNQGLNVDEWGNVDAYFLYVGNIATGWDDNVSTYAISSEDGSDLYLTTDSTGTGNNNILLIPQGTGKVGIGTTTPQATLDVNGYAKLLPQTAAPATCTSTNKGAIAMTTNNGLCFCNGSAWNKVESPATACAW